MPNWAMNKVYVSGPPKIVADLKHVVSTRDMRVPEEQRSYFDFNSIIPMPSPLRTVNQGHCIDDNGVKCSIWRKVNGKNIAIPKSTLQRWRRDYGHVSWYDWASANWGTKWNPGDVELKVDNPDLKVYEFNTAWAPPWPIYRRLVEAYPELQITWEYSLEDEGYERWHTYPKGILGIKQAQEDYEKAEEALEKWKAQLDKNLGR